MVIVGMIVQILLGGFFTPEGVIKWTHMGPSTARFRSVQVAVAMT